MNVYLLPFHKLFCWQSKYLLISLENTHLLWSALFDYAVKLFVLNCVRQADLIFGYGNPLECLGRQASMGEEMAAIFKCVWTKPTCSRIFIYCIWRSAFKQIESEKEEEKEKENIFIENMKAVAWQTCIFLCREGTCLYLRRNRSCLCCCCPTTQVLMAWIWLKQRMLYWWNQSWTQHRRHRLLAAFIGLDRPGELRTFSINQKSK